MGCFTPSIDKGARRTFRLHVYCLAFSIILWAAWTPPGTAADGLVPTTALPRPAVSAAAFFVDGTEEGAADLLLADSDGVEIWSVAGGVFGVGEGPLWRRRTGLAPLPAPVTAVAVGDVTGDGVPELVLGTGQAGAVYVARRAGDTWTLLGQTPYLWSPVRDVLVVDLSGDGRAEIVAVGEDGSWAVFGWRDLSLQSVGSMPSDVGLVAHVAALLAEGTARLAVAAPDGRVSVLSWPLERPDWQTFVWGTPASLAAVTGPEGEALVVTTTERLLYKFRRQGEEFVAAGPALTDPRLPFTFTVPVRLSDDPRPHLLAAHAGGLGLWRLDGAAATPVAEGWAEQPTWALPVPGGDAFIVAEARGAAAVWVRRPGTFFEFTVDGRPRPLRDPPLFHQSQVMLSARDWADALGLQLFWDGGEDRLTIVRGPEYAVVTVDEWEVLLPRGRRTLSVPPRLLDGRVYVPPELPAWFGFDFRWDPRRRALDLRPRPGQGINPTAPNS